MGSYRPQATKMVLQWHATRWSDSGHATRRRSYRQHATKVVLQWHATKWSYSGHAARRGSYRHHATRWSYSRHAARRGLTDTMPQSGLTVACHQVALQQSCRPKGVLQTSCHEVVLQWHATRWSYSGHAARSGSYSHHATKVVLQ
jgi:hypothetical protein